MYLNTTKYKYPMYLTQVCMLSNLMANSDHAICHLIRNTHNNKLVQHVTSGWELQYSGIHYFLCFSRSKERIDETIEFGSSLMDIK